MDNSTVSNTGQQAARYQFRVAGVIGPTLTDAFPALTAQHAGGITTLTGSMADQAAVHGVLTLIESLGMELVAVERLPATGDESTGSNDYQSSGRTGRFGPGNLD